MAEYKKTNDKMPFWKHTFWPFVIILAGALIYSGYLDNGWIYDDEYLITDSKAYETPFEFNDLFEDLGTVLYGEPMGYWRPGQILLYRMEYLLFGMEPFGWHLTGLALHILAACMLYMLLYRLLKNRHAAGLAALVFLSHPVVTEVVGSNNYQISSIEGLFVLAGLFCWLKKRAFIATVFMAAALLFRESALVVPVLFTLFLGFVPGRFEKRNLALLIAPFALAVLYLLARFAWLGQTQLYAEEAFGFFQRVGLIAFYSAKVIAIPALWSLSIVHDLQPSTVATLTGWSVIVICIAFCSWLAWRVKKGADPAALILFAAFLVAASPYAGVIPPYILFAEHYLYMPLAFLVGSVCALSLPNRRKKILVAGVLILTLFYSAISFSRSNVFIDNGMAFSDALTKYPNSVKSLMSLGTHHYRNDEINEAVVIYHKVLSLTNGKHEKAWNNIGDIYFRVKMWEKAEECFKKAGQEGRRNLVVLLFIQKRLAELHPMVTELYDENPEDTVIKEIYDSVIEND